MAASAETGGPIACAAALIQEDLRYQDHGGAMAEALAPADNSHNGETIADWPGRPYLASLACRDCELCGGSARAELSFETGGTSVEADDCLVVDSCMKSWADMYPEDLTSQDGSVVAPVLPCSKDGCEATFQLERSYGIVPVAVRQTGTCDIDRANTSFKTYGRDILNSMVSSQNFNGPDADTLDAFDGQR